MKFEADLNRTLDQYIGRERETRNELTHTIVRVALLEAKVENLGACRVAESNDKWKLNVIIKGFPESKSEKMHIVMKEFFEAARTSFPYSLTHGARWLGIKPTSTSGKDTPKYSRPVKLALLSLQQKSELFGLKQNYTRVDKFFLFLLLSFVD